MFQKLAGPASSASARLETLRLAQEHLGAPEGSEAASSVALLDREADLINRQELRNRHWDGMTSTLNCSRSSIDAC